MGWRFRKSFSPLPGIRLTLSPSGISTSAGVGPIRLTAGPRGAALNVNAPGTGLSLRQPLYSDEPKSTHDLLDPLAPRVTTRQPFSQDVQLTDIKSAGSGALTTAGLGEFKRLLEQARREYRDTSRELAAANTHERINVNKYNQWNNGWLFRRIFRNKFRRLAECAEEATARREELQAQESLSRLNTQIELPTGISHAFHRMRDEFSVLAKAARIWDTVGLRTTNQVIERTAATRVISRELASFCLDKCEVIDSEWDVPHMANANGGDIFLYPGFVLYFVSTETFALLEYKEIYLDFSPSRFFEEEAVPHDSRVVGQTWSKINKDGTPDRRFKGNYQIPIMEYGRLVLSSPTGLNEEYMISNSEQTEAFSKSWKELVHALEAGV